jgi:hypothetical protein
MSSIVTANTQAYRDGRGYTVTVANTTTGESWVQYAKVTLPKHTAFDGQVSTGQGPERLGGGVAKLGDIAMTIPQDNSKVEGTRLSLNSTDFYGLTLTKTGENARVYFVKMMEDGGADIGPDDANGQQRSVTFGCQTLGATVAITLPAGVKNSAYTGSFTATGKKRTGATETYTFVLASGTTLQTGLTLATGGGVTGTPTAAGVVTGEVVITSAEGYSAIIPFTLTIADS